MDRNYVDQFITRKKSGGVHTPTPAATMSDVAHEDSRAMLSSRHGAPAAAALATASEMAQLIDRGEVQGHQITVFEDKLVNLTKLVKLSQTLSDEKEADMKKEIHELRQRVKRQEHAITKLGNELEAWERNGVTKDYLEAKLKEVVGRMDTAERDTASSIAQVKDLIEVKVHETHSNVLEAANAHSEALHAARHAAVQDSINETREAVRSVQHDVNRDLHAMEDRQQKAHQERLDYLHKHTDDRMASALSAQKESIMTEVRSCISAMRQEVSGAARAASEDGVSECLKRLHQMEEQQCDFSDSLRDYIVAFKSHAENSTAKNDEIGRNVHQMMSVHESTRQSIAQELETTKQWATRNMQRLKKHIDTLHCELKAAREAQSDLVAEITRNAKAEEHEREKLTELLAQKSKEARALHEMVDKEIHGLGRLAQEREGKRRSLAGQSAEQFAERSRHRNREVNSLYNELAFADRSNPRH